MTRCIEPNELEFFERTISILDAQLAEQARLKALLEETNLNVERAIGARDLFFMFLCEKHGMNPSTARLDTKTGEWHDLSS